MTTNLNTTIKTDDIQSTTIPEAIAEILSRYDIGHLALRLNIGAGDLAEAIATHIVMTDTDWTPDLMSSQMTLDEAIEELQDNINLRGAHAVLLRDATHGYRTELHAGHAGNCCCDRHPGFVWREEAPYTRPDVMIADIQEAIR